jgi:hypothetical protein
MLRASFALVGAGLLVGAAAAQDLRAPAELQRPPATADGPTYIVEMKILEGQPLTYEGDRGGEELVDLTNLLGAAPAAADLLQATAAREIQPAPDSPEDAERPADALPAPPRAQERAVESDGTGWWDDANRVPPGMTVLSAPRVALVPNSPATVQIATEQIFTYLRPLGNGKFERKQTARKELGLTINLAVQPAEGDDGFVDISPLEIRISSLDGREPVVGLEDLEVGEPIIAKRSLETTARMRLGDTRAILLPSGPKTQAILVLRVKQFDPETHE